MQRTLYMPQLWLLPSLGVLVGWVLEKTPPNMHRQQYKQLACPIALCM